MQNFFLIWPNFFQTFADNPVWDLATVNACRGFGPTIFFVKKTSLHGDPGLRVKFVSIVISTEFGGTIANADSWSAEPLILLNLCQGSH
jgi:hypothetical protein